MRHSVERARAATRVVSPLPGSPDGALGGCAGARPTVEHTQRCGGESTVRGAEVAAHPAAATSGLSLDCGASRRRAAHPAWEASPRAHPALCRNAALGSGRPHRTNGRGRRITHAPNASGTDDSHHAVRERARPRRRRPGLCRAIRAAGHQPEHPVELLGRRRRGLARHPGQRGRDRRGVHLRGDADPLAHCAPRRRVRASRPARATVHPGVVGRMCGAAGQSFVGPGLRHRAGDPGRALRPDTQTDRPVVDRLGRQLPGLRLRHVHQLRQRTPKASPTTP